ncbi:glycosyltransferase family protein [Microbacterium gorillae]|uniref:glycosyltransferase family 1 protein n=1 Tax=Microbacterium gorillae TaxID=1231063 RepID=UPI0006936324|nr:glycosyltransferase family 1 protein [Microbacterium gorillae]
MSPSLRSRIVHHPVVARLWHEWQDRRAARDAGTTPITRAERTLFIGPVNSAGQGFAWARAAERIPGVAAADFMYRNPDDVFGFPADHEVPTVFFRVNKHWQRAQRRAVRRRFSHVIVESGRHLFGSDGAVSDQVRPLIDRGVQVALLWHGSDIRSPGAHAAAEPDSPFHGDRYADTERLTEITAVNHALMRELALPVFVSTPDLLRFVPGATWLPVVVDVQRWARPAPPQRLANRPVVVHAPSNAGLKGTELITELMRRLDAEGLVEYREIHGVAAADMPGIYGEADIVLDQFGLGIYGVAAVEAMAAGRLVISHVGDDVREAVRHESGRELPIVEARAVDLERVLREVVARPDRFAEIAASGVSFAGEVHDGARSARALESFLAAGRGARRPLKAA